MTFEIPDEYRYTESHEWIVELNGTYRVGITDFAQDELGDIVFVELPTVGDSLDVDEEFGVIESIKAVSEIYAPVAGTVVAANDELLDQPEFINEDPFDQGWMVEIESEETIEHLLSPSEYKEQIE